LLYSRNHTKAINRPTVVRLYLTVNFPTILSPQTRREATQQPLNLYPIINANPNTTPTISVFRSVTWQATIIPRNLGTTSCQQVPEIALAGGWASVEEETGFRLRRDGETLSAALLRTGSGGGGNEVKPETVHRGAIEKFMFDLENVLFRCCGVDFMSRRRHHLFWSASGPQQTVLHLVLLFFVGFLLLFSWIGKSAAVFRQSHFLC